MSDDAYRIAKDLACSLYEKHFKDDAPNWKPLPDLIGVITQMDNMTAALGREKTCEWKPMPDQLRLYVPECLGNEYEWHYIPEAYSYCPFCGGRMIHKPEKSE